MKFFIHFFVILALVTAGISPACAFIGGQKGWIEICASDGTVQKIRVSEDFLPVSQDEQVPSGGHESAMDDCAFCFLSANGKSLITSTLITSKPALGGYLKIGAGSFMPETQKLSAFSARAPPVYS